LRRFNGTRYKYDKAGNLLRKTAVDGRRWEYRWYASGQLTHVSLPNGYAVTFTYDALGRRVSKYYRGRITRWLWDGDKTLHEWTELAVGPGSGAVQDLITWLFEERSFTPLVKLTAQDSYSVVADQLGTPLALYDGQGTKTWQAQLDSYGQVRQGWGKAQDCPLRYQGQYEDVETGLYYNRFRYYDPQVELYISQDPIKLQGGGKLYSYVDNPNAQLDPYGLFPGPAFFSDLKWSGMGHHTVPRAHVNMHGLNNLGAKCDSPAWYPQQADVTGSYQIHHDAHLALEQNVVPFNPGSPSANNPVSQADLLTKASATYKTPGLDQKGVLRIPSTGEIIADNVTMAEAMEKALE
jgi:RHS repeat-associated protein